MSGNQINEEQHANVEANAEQLLHEAVEENELNELFEEMREHGIEFNEDDEIIPYGTAHVHYNIDQEILVGSVPGIVEIPRELWEAHHLNNNIPVDIITK